MYDSDLNNYIDTAILGVCYNESGTVHLAFHKTTNTTVVIKKFNIDDKESDEYMLVEKEIHITKQLQHPNVLPYLYSFVSGQSIYVVSPLMQYGSCNKLLSEYFTDGLPELAIAFIFKDVLQGLEYIHKRGFIHRAIRAGHILISGSGQACISGMRYTCNVIKNGRWQKNIYSFPKSTAHNLKWLSPEVLEQDLRGYNEKSDIYSIGMTICELANGVEPFYDMPVTLMLTEKVRGSVPYIIDQSTFPLNSADIEQLKSDDMSNNSQNISGKRFEVLSKRKFSESFHALTELCLQRDPSNRPSASQLQNHPFFKQCRKSDEILVDILKPASKIQEVYINVDGDNNLDTPIEQMRNLNSDTCQWDFDNET